MWIKRPIFCPLAINQMTQLEKDIAFCIDECEMSNEQIGDILRCCENLGGIPVEYFAEEFVFESDNNSQVHDDDYLNIAEFNSMYWEA